MEKQNTYTSKAGDTWDSIAFEIYGNEKYAQLLMESNFDKLDNFVFSSGVVLIVPELTAENDEDELPEWRRE